MNLQHLRTLLTIVEQGSLSQAARAMDVSQPAVTKQVQRLEQELEAALLVRGPQQQVALTPAGEQVLVFARDTLTRFEDLWRQASQDLAAGYALDNEEAEIGVGCIGVLLRDPAGEPLAGLSISAPRERRRDEWVELILEAARRIQERIAQHRGVGHRLEPIQAP